MGTGGIGPEEFAEIEPEEFVHYLGSPRASAIRATGCGPPPTPRRARRGARPGRDLERPRPRRAELMRVRCHRQAALDLIEVVRRKGTR